MARSHFSDTQHSRLQALISSAVPTSVKLPDFSPPLKVTPSRGGLFVHCRLCVAGLDCVLLAAKIKTKRRLFRDLYASFLISCPYFFFSIRAYVRACVRACVRAYMCAYVSARQCVHVCAELF